MAKFLYKFLSGKGRMKPQVIIIGAIMVIAVFAISVISAYRDAAQQKKKPSNPFVTQQVQPKRDLDYKIIKVDSIPYNNLALQDAKKQAESATQLSPQQKQGQSSTTASQGVPGQRTPSKPKRTTTVVATRNPAIPAKRNSNASSNMIIVDKSGQQQTLSGGSLSGGITGLQSVRLKLLVLERTPVSNGSLVEARVMNDARYGNVQIPRRSQLLGIARLQNNRVEIDFREIRIEGKTYTCSGRAYDLKNLPGIQYNPLNANAKQALLNEFKSAASGVPVVGRIVNQPNFNPITDEITSLDEGLEFYALITNIF
ncbi:MAG: conjugative transposon protein TraM [bacterium]